MKTFSALYLLFYPPHHFLVHPSLNFLLSSELCFIFSPSKMSSLILSSTKWLHHHCPLLSLAPCLCRCEIWWGLKIAISCFFHCFCWDVSHNNITVRIFLPFLHPNSPILTQCHLAPCVCFRPRPCLHTIVNAQCRSFIQARVSRFPSSCATITLADPLNAHTHSHTDSLQTTMFQCASFSSLSCGECVCVLQASPWLC